MVREPENRVNVALVCASSAEAYRSAFQALQKNGVLLIVGIPSAPLQWTAGDLIRSGVRIIPSRVASRRELSDLVKLAQRRRGPLRNCFLPAREDQCSDEGAGRRRNPRPGRDSSGS